MQASIEGNLNVLFYGTEAGKAVLEPVSLQPRAAPKVGGRSPKYVGGRCMALICLLAFLLSHQANPAQKLSSRPLQPPCPLTIL